MNKAVMAAITKTLQAYEALMENPAKEKHKWEFVGRCRICRAREAAGNFHCHGCPIDVNDSNCVDNRWGEGSKNDVIHACVNNLPSAKIKAAAKRRYRELLRRLKNNGYEYK